MFKKIAFLLFIAFLSFQVQGQSCKGFHLSKDCAVPDVNDYRRYGQSRSRVVVARQTVRYQVTLFGGYDYKVGICTENAYEPVHFKIIDANRNSVFYDNTNDDYMENVGFTVDETKNVIIEMTVLAEDREFTDAPDYRTCLGVAIYWRKVPNIGFDMDNQ